MKIKTFRHAVTLGALALATWHGAPVGATAQSVPEPETVFYGKVINRAGPQAHLVTEGLLNWSIGKPDGSGVPLLLTTKLEPLADGRYSYRVGVPHSALALGLGPISGTVPLGIAIGGQRHLDIDIDGVAARIVAPGEYEFEVAQSLRAATYRLDLEISSEMPDSDSDGMPDWWEQANGLDSQADDAAGDLDGDGASNLAEWRAGSSANRDDRSPEIATVSMLAYGKSTTAVPLRVRDVDSLPEQLIITVASLPSNAKLVLRNAVEDSAAPDAELAVGSTFSQAEVDRGQLVLVHEPGDGARPERTHFAVTARDEDPGHAVAEGDIEVAFYLPELPQSGTAEILADAIDPGPLAAVAAEEESRVRAFVLGSEAAYIVWDLGAQEGQPLAGAPTGGLAQSDYTGAYQPKFGDERPAIIIGSPVADRLTGGVADDIFIAGGGDDMLAGGLGTDCFIIESASDGSDTITDFNPAEGDCIDLSRVLRGSSANLASYVKLDSGGGDSRLRVDIDGDGSGFTDLVVTLRGHSFVQADLFNLWVTGALRSGLAELPSRISVVAASAYASENGPVAGNFEVKRVGALGSDLEVHLRFSGSASNGVDFAMLPSTVIIPSGQDSVLVPVLPFPDGLAEGNEMVQLSVLPSATYALGEQTVAVMPIIDRLPEITLETLEPRAVVEGGKSALVLLRRGGVLDRSLLVRLSIGGSATNGSDFVSISPFANLASGETTKLIEIQPRPGADIAGPAETAIFSVLEDPNYILGETAKAATYLIAEELSLADWRERNYPGDISDLADFLAADPGSYGVPNLLRYGFGLDAGHPGRVGVPTIDLVDGRAIISFDRNLTATDLTYILELSRDARSWRPAGSAVESVDDISRPWKSTFRSLAPATDAGEMLFRVRIQPR